MSFHTFQYYTFNTDPSSESPSNNQNEPELMLRELQFQLQSRQLAFSSPALTPMNFKSFTYYSLDSKNKIYKIIR